MSEFDEDNEIPTFEHEYDKYDEHDEKEAFKKLDLNRSSSPYQVVSTHMIRGIKYYTKPHTSDKPVKIWNDLYGKKTGRLLLYEDAIYEDSISYFPELGISIIDQGEHICNDATRLAQEALNEVGYYHNDLYHLDNDSNTIHSNCTNVREYMGKYYPIDTEKIFPIDTEEIVTLDKNIGGNKKRKVNKKSKKVKKNNNRKSKRKSKKKSKKKLEKKSKK